MTPSIPESAIYKIKAKKHHIKNKTKITIENQTLLKTKTKEHNTLSTKYAPFGTGNK